MNNTLQVLQRESLKSGLLGTLAELTLVPQGRTYASFVSGETEGLGLKTVDWSSMLILKICVGKLPMKRSQHGPNL